MNGESELGVEIPAAFPEKGWHNSYCRKKYPPQFANESQKFAQPWRDAVAAGPPSPPKKLLLSVANAVTPQRASAGGQVVAERARAASRKTINPLGEENNDGAIAKNKTKASVTNDGNQSRAEAEPEKPHGGRRFVFRENKNKPLTLCGSNNLAFVFKRKSWRLVTLWRAELLYSKKRVGMRLKGVSGTPQREESGSVGTTSNDRTFYLLHREINSIQGSF